MSSLSCPECGARLAEGVERCDLCGASIADMSEASQAPGRSADDIPEPHADPPAEDDGVYCNECGWKNPAGANFCSRCGTKLQAASLGAGSGQLNGPKPSAVASGARPVEADELEAASAAGTQAQADGDDASMGRHVALLLGIAVLVVIALYMITVISKQPAEPRAEAAVEAPADVRSAAVIDESESIPVAERYAATVDSFRTAIDSSQGEAVNEARRDLVDFFVQIGRIDRAAIEAQRLARQTGDADDWQRAGDLLYDWMETVSPERKTDVALLTIQAYETVLEQRPGDLDARADLGWAYQYDPQNPMRAIEQTNRVLEEDPDHLAANYNRGVFLLRINRLDDAVQQFQRVAELAGEESPYAQQADAWIRTIREQRSAQQQ